MTLSIIIPVYNEESSILALVERVKNAPLGQVEKEIIIVNDASTDSTAKLLESIRGQCQIIHHSVNRGKGSAIRTGLARATGEYVVVQDADLEYDPADLGIMLKRMIQEKFTVLYGSRRLKKENTQYSGLSFYIGGVFLTTLVNILYKQSITDEPTCYKMFRTDFLRSLPLRCERFDFCPEVTALTALRGVSITEVPISYHPRHESEGKKIKWSDGLDATMVLIRYRLQSFRLLAPITNRLFERDVFVIFCLSIISLALYSLTFGFRPNNDTDSFVSLIHFFRTYSGDVHPNRYLNPFYAVVSAQLLPFASEAGSIVILNIIFYIAIALLTYGLVRRVFAIRWVAVVSSLLFMTSYAVIRYGLTQVQDIGGFFWYVLTLYTGWRWFEDKRLGWLVIGGVSVSFGMLTKESGAMGALFVGVLLLLARTSLVQKIKDFLTFSAIPFVVLIVNQMRGLDVDYSSKQWFIDNWHIYAATNYTPFKWFGVNATTFNVLWIFAAIGLYVIIRRWRDVSVDIKYYLAAVTLPSLSYFAWPLFISRTVFIAGWLMMPLGAFGMYYLWQKKYWLGNFCVAVAIIMPIVIQLTIGYVPLFYVIEKCHYDPVCSVKIFVNARHEFNTFQVHSDRMIDE